MRQYTHTSNSLRAMQQCEQALKFRWLSFFCAEAIIATGVLLMYAKCYINEMSQVCSSFRQFLNGFCTKLMT